VHKIKDQNTEIRILQSASNKFIGKFTACFFAVSMIAGCLPKNYDNKGQIVEIFKEVNAEQAEEQEIRMKQQEIRQPYFHHKRLKIAPPEIA
jgi:hypothetical protein